jgi:uncharacterized protein with FMN-binding domain
MARSFNKTILVTRPNYDLVTNYLYYWSKKIIDEARKKGLNVLDIKDSKVTAKEFEGRLQKMQPELVVINGHGNSSTIVGHNEEPILHVNTAEKVSGTIVYARSCNSATILGARCVSKGTRAYIGYSEKFWLCFDKAKTHHPLEDKIAAYVLGPSNQTIISLMKGNAAGDASKRSKEYSRRMMSRLMSSDAPDGANDMLACVWTNMNFQVCLGNASASI